MAVGLLGVVNAWATLRLHRRLARRSSTREPASLHESILSATTVMTDRRVRQLVRSNVPLLAVFVSEGCAHCHRIMPQLNAFAREHAGDAAVVAVIAGSSEDARRLAKMRGLDLPAISGNEIGQAVPWTPYVFVCDTYGAIVEEGPLSGRADLETLLQAALAGSASGPAPAMRTPVDTTRRGHRRREPGVLRHHFAELERVLRGRDFGESAVIHVGDKRTKYTIDLGPQGPPTTSISITRECLRDIVVGRLCLSAALASGALAPHGSIRTVGEILEILSAISSSAADALQPTGMAAQGVARFNALHGLNQLSREIDDPALLGAAVLAAGTPLSRLFRIAQLNDAYMSSQVSAAEYHDLVRGLLELVARTGVRSASSIPQPPHVEEFSHVR
ncbi:MAG: hypothetical protein WKF96_10105 [Solirubrobacteraceae bacterium]